jgi:hypothetical protein
VPTYEVVISRPIKRQWFEFGRNLIAGETFGVEILAILAAFKGPTLLPIGGRLGRALDTISIHPEHEVDGMVKFPL